jgi:hypothetical protein
MAGIPPPPPFSPIPFSPQPKQKINAEDEKEEKEKKISSDANPFIPILPNNPPAASPLPASAPLSGHTVKEMSKTVSDILEKYKSNPTALKTDIDKAKNIKLDEVDAQQKTNIKWGLLALIAAAVLLTVAVLIFTGGLAAPAMGIAAIDVAMSVMTPLGGAIMSMLVPAALGAAAGLLWDSRKSNVANEKAEAKTKYQEIEKNLKDPVFLKKLEKYLLSYTPDPRDTSATVEKNLEKLIFNPKLHELISKEEGINTMHKTIKGHAVSSDIKTVIDLLSDKEKNYISSIVSRTGDSWKLGMPIDTLVRLFEEHTNSAADQSFKGRWNMAAEGLVGLANGEMDKLFLDNGFLAPTQVTKDARNNLLKNIATTDVLFPNASAEAGPIGGPGSTNPPIADAIPNKAAESVIQQYIEVRNKGEGERIDNTLGKDPLFLELLQKEKDFNALHNAMIKKGDDIEKAVNSLSPQERNLLKKFFPSLSWNTSKNWNDNVASMESLNKEKAHLFTEGWRALALEIHKEIHQDYVDIIKKQGLPLKGTQQYEVERKSLKEEPLRERLDRDAAAPV